jgi:hypothetical protein
VFPLYDQVQPEHVVPGMHAYNTAFLRTSACHTSYIYAVWCHLQDAVFPLYDQVKPEHVVPGMHAAAQHSILNNTCCLVPLAGRCVPAV